MTEKAERAANGLTAKVMIIGVLTTLFWGAFFSPHTKFHTHAPVLMSTRWSGFLQDSYLVPWGHFGSIGFVFVLEFIILGINKAARKPVFSKAEMATLAAMVPIGIWMNTNHTGQFEATMSYGIGIAMRDNFAELATILPDIWGANIPLSVYQTVLGFSGPIPWVEFAPLLLWNIMYFLGFYFLHFFAAALIRPLWQDTERIPFFIASVKKGMLDITYSGESEKKGGGKLKWFLVGFLINFVWTFLTRMQAPIMNIIPPMGLGRDQYFRRTGYIWGTDIVAAPVLEVCSLGTFLPWVPLIISLWPHQVGWAYMLSFDVLYGFVLGWLVFFLVVPTTLAGAGLLPEFPSYNAHDIHTVLDGFESLYATYPCLNVGGLIALVVYPLFTFRRNIAFVFRSLYSRVNDELEARSPIPYKLIWIGAIASLVVSLSSFYVLNVAAAPITLVTLIDILLILGFARLVLETGGPGGLAGVYGFEYLDGMFGSGAIQVFGVTPELSKTGFANWWALWIRRTWGFNGGAVRGAAFSSWWLLDELEVGRLVNADNKGTFKAVAIALAATVIASVIGYFVIINYFPAYSYTKLGQRIPVHGGAAANNVYNNFEAGNWYYWGAWQDAFTTYSARSIATIIAGFAIITSMFILRRKFTWFMLAPTGFLLGMWYWGSSSVLFASFAAAMVLKWITMRVGGAKFYETKGRPLCLGLWVSFVFLMFFNLLFHVAGRYVLTLDQYYAFEG